MKRQIWNVQILTILLLGGVVASVASIDPPNTVTLLQIEQRIETNTKRIEALSDEINDISRAIISDPQLED